MDIHAITGFLGVIPIDWLIVSTAFIIILLGTLVRGTGYATALCLSLPISALLFVGIAHTTFLSTIAQQFSKPFEQAIMFAILLVIMFVCMYRICATFDHSASPLTSLIAALATVIVIMVIWIQVLPLDTLWHPGAQMQSLFGQSYSLFWLLVSYLALAFARS
jgi:hypothetical protein